MIIKKLDSKLIMNFGIKAIAAKNLITLPSLAFIENKNGNLKKSKYYKKNVLFNQLLARYVKRKFIILTIADLDQKKFSPPYFSIFNTYCHLYEPN